MSDITDPKYKISSILADSAAAFGSDEKVKAEQKKKVNAVFQLNVKGPDGEKPWTIDLKKTATIYKGPPADGLKADVVITATDDVFVQIANGKLAGQKAFMTGKLKAKGNIMQATKLGDVLSASKKAKL